MRVHFPAKWCGLDLGDRRGCPLLLAANPTQARDANTRTNTLTSAHSGLLCYDGVGAMGSHDAKAATTALRRKIPQPTSRVGVKIWQTLPRSTTTRLSKIPE